MRATRSFIDGLLAVIAIGVVSPASAITFTVNSVSDVAAAPPFANGVCETAPGNGVCTLRAAIMKANHFPGGGATIVLPASAFPYRITIAPSGVDDETTGDLNITAEMTIAGDGAAVTIIDGGATDRVLRIDAARADGFLAAVTITGVTIRNGSALSNTAVSLAGGGGIYVGRGALALSDSTISGNRALYGGGIGIGSRSPVTLTRVTVTGNHAERQGGGILSGGVLSNGALPLTIEQSVVADNSAGDEGGGISSDAGLVVSRTVVAGNTAGYGGGIAVDSTYLDNAPVVTNSTIVANRAINYGGGIWANSDMNPIPVAIVNSTLSANSAGGNGGGIATRFKGRVRVFHTTIAGNIAGSGSVGLGAGGGFYGGPDTAGSELWNSLLAENYVGSVRNDCGGNPIASQDYNYIQTLAGCTLTGTTAHNVTGGDALLDGLNDNGGPTPTRALLPGSPALDRIPTPLCRDALGGAPVPDQRGVSRPVGTLCDIGAFEGSKSASLLGRNLIRNGDGEDGGGSLTSAPVGLPGWTVGGQLTAVPYGLLTGFPSADTVNPGGYNFFAGGNAQISTGDQAIAVTSLAPAIDAGQINFTLAGDFGGYATEEDAASLTIRFLNAAGATVGPTYTIGSVSAAERGNITGFRQRSVSTAVPATTRSIGVTLRMQRMAASGYNDGYADNLSLVLADKAGAVAPAIEYYHAEFDHYFITALPDEIAKLDAGVFAGWARVGEDFNVLSDTPAASTPVCRFFSTAFGIRSSHFYTPDPTECEIVKQNADWQFEGNVFNVELPADDGSCTAGWQPVYRLYNNGQGGAPNHRYTTSLTVRSQMMAIGWIPEGSGIGVAMCAPL